MVQGRHDLFCLVKIQGRFSHKDISARPSQKHKMGTQAQSRPSTQLSPKPNPRTWSIPWRTPDASHRTPCQHRARNPGLSPGCLNPSTASTAFLSPPSHQLWSDATVKSSACLKPTCSGAKWRLISSLQQVRCCNCVNAMQDFHLPGKKLRVNVSSPMNYIIWRKKPQTLLIWSFSYVI